MFRLLPIILVGASAVCAQADVEALVGSVLDPDGKPIAGARVEIWRAGGHGMGGLDLDYRYTFARTAVTPTDRHGRFALQVPTGLPFRLCVDQPPFARWVRDYCIGTDDMQIRLEPPATFRGCLKGADGAPATGTLRAWHRDTGTELLRGRTDANGAFCFDRLPSCPLRVEVLPDAAPSPPWRDLVLMAGTSDPQEFQLDSGRLLRGRVVDADTGEPIAGARIGEGWTLRRRVTTDADGRYELRGFGSRDAGDLYCQADGHVEQMVKADKQGEGPLTVDFRLARGLAAKGRVVDPDGKPMAGVYVQVFGSVHDGHDQTNDCIGLRTDAEGRFETRGLHPELDHVVVIRREGWATAVYALPPANADGSKIAGDLMLTKPLVVRGVLLGPDGQPRADTKVMLWGYNDDRHRLDPEGKLARSPKDNGLVGWNLLNMYVGGREVRTDAHGRFSFGDVPVGSFRLTAYDDRNGKIAVGDNFRPAAGMKAIELVSAK